MNGERLEQSWTPVCDLNDIVPDTGVCALINGAQVAIFHVADGNDNTNASVFARVPEALLIMPHLRPRRCLKGAEPRRRSRRFQRECRGTRRWRARLTPAGSHLP